jgi:hypothetical protein
VRVSGDRRRELRAWCKRHRMTQAAAVDAGLALLFAADRQ